MELTVVVSQDRTGFWSEVAELPGCFASGRTLGELREALAEAVGLYLWDLPAVAAGESELALGECTLRVVPPPPAAA